MLFQHIRYQTRSASKRTMRRFRDTCKPRSHSPSMGEICSISTCAIASCPVHGTENITIMSFPWASLSDNKTFPIPIHHSHLTHDRKHTLNVSSNKECNLPMDMECGCKTKREKEEQEALALEIAAKKQEQQQQVYIRPKQQPCNHQHRPIVHVTNSSLTTFHGDKLYTPPNSFHRRHLPQDCIAFSSTRGRQLFVEALNTTPSSRNYMQIYFPLAEQFITQAEPAYCGLSTLAMCLNALQIDPGRLWKGSWRWFSEELFDCCTSLAVAKEKGISLSDFICLARCNGVQTMEQQATDSFSLEMFRTIVKASCSTPNEIVVLNYSRKVLGQTGDGHFSPIGGYHEAQDMVLLLDVARFKYPPHWVKLSLVFEAMQQIDVSSGMPRGLVVLKEGAHATGPTLIKNLVHKVHSDVSQPIKPVPTVCCSSKLSLESARHAVMWK